MGGGIPALLAHPDWLSPAPTMIWLHGRTAYKELDPGRYQRWLKAGMAAVAVDLPGHGERTGEGLSSSLADTLPVLRQAIDEIDMIVEALADPVWQGVFDLDRLGIGGMSMGGMATLRRLCDPHEFRCAAVESTCGDLLGLYQPGSGHAQKTQAWGQTYPPEVVRPLNAASHIETFAPLPLLSLHSEADEIVPWRLQEGFLDRLGVRYQMAGADAGMIERRTWPTTGAPFEHSGFGRVSAEAKDVQTEFLRRVLVEEK